MPKFRLIDARTGPIAKIWSATSLPRLLAEQGRRATRQRPGRAGLCLFHRGFETADLTDAKAFLDELG
jgi:hypothetical protein